MNIDADKTAPISHLTDGTLVGHYRIVRKIGAGGMGEVYLAQDPRLNRNVALKFLPAHLAQDAHVRARFAREAQAAAALDHPNVVTVHEVGEFQGRPFIAMQYVEGETLRYHCREMPLPLEKIPGLAAQIADGLARAHTAGLIHRDVKSANIILDHDDRPRILDFGLAAIQGAEVLTQAGTTLGTAAYMSPEQIRGGTVDQRSDLFSLGVVLYELITGRLPFDDENVNVVLHKIATEEPEPLARFKSGVPSELQRIVTRCLAKDPGERFQTAADLAAELRRVGRAMATSGSAGAQTGGPPSIAVLPFANMSADPENEYFADGLAEEILNLLAKIPELKVIARTSSFAFRGKEQDITAIAAALRVRYVLEGSVRRAGTRIRVTAQLISAVDGSHMWSDRYDRKVTDVFAIQDEISEAISTALHLRLGPRVKEVNIEAYQYHLKGRHHLMHLSPESLAKARECYERALSVDPDFAPAHSALAEHYHTLYLMGFDPAEKVVPLAREAAEKALAIDPGHGESRSILASLADTVDYQGDVAEALHRRALKAEPVTSIIQFRYAVWHLLPRERIDEARTLLQAALETDPLNMPAQWGMVWCHNASEQHGEAINCAREVLELDDTSYLIWSAMGHAQLASGDPKAAMSTFGRMVEVAPWSSEGIGSLAAACHISGSPGRAEELAQPLAPGRGLAIYQAATGNADAMFQGLEVAWQQRDGLLPLVRIMPVFEPYLQDPRFCELLVRMNLVAAKGGS